MDDRKTSDWKKMAKYVPRLRRRKRVSTCGFQLYEKAHGGTEKQNRLYCNLPVIPVMIYDNLNFTGKGPVTNKHKFSRHLAKQAFFSGFPRVSLGFFESVAHTFSPRVLFSSSLPLFGG
jgi:hypothetical protein